MKPEDRKRLKQHIEMIVEHKTPIEELEDMNRKLRLELHTLRFKEAQEQRFIWWIWNVYSRNVNDLIYDIMGATTYDTEGEAKDGKYSLPKHCFDLIKKIDEYTEHIYDGTYLDVEISKDAKTVISEGSEPSNSDVSVTQDVLTDIKTGQSIENTNPDYYKQEIARLNAERRWIPVSERLPEMYHPVLTMAKKAKYPRVLSREKGADDIWVWALRQLGGYVAYIGEKNITHWMPLPEPPESEV